jgi:hypothetical protein
MRVDETPAAELWRRTLARIPSIFGRLVYLASLRDLNTGFYQHFGFQQQVGDKEADRTIRRSHANTFADWLCFSLGEQREHLERYLDDAGGDKLQILANWRLWPSFMNWIPAQARDAEKALFRSDLETLIDLITLEVSSASPGRNASRHP